VINEEDLSIGDIVILTGTGARCYINHCFEIIGFDGWDHHKDVILLYPLGFEVKPGPNSPYNWNGLSPLSVSIVDVRKLSPLEQLGIQSR